MKETIEAERVNGHVMIIFGKFLCVQESRSLYSTWPVLRGTVTIYECFVRYFYLPMTEACSITAGIFHEICMK
jgi:hypothetical protein